MKNTCVILLTTVSTFAVAQERQNFQPPQPDNNMLWYRAPAKAWVEALPIGNGRFGAMIYGGIEQERMQLNEITVWSGDPQPDADRAGAYQYLDTIRDALHNGDYKKGQKLTEQYFTSPAPYDASYQTLGDIKLHFRMPGSQQISNYVRWLDIKNALSGVAFRAGDISFKREVFASHADKAIIEHITSSAKNSISFELELSRIERAQTRFVAPNKLIMTGNAGGKLTYEVQLTINTRGGRITNENGKMVISNANEVTFVVTAGTSYLPDYTKLFVGPDPHQQVNKATSAAVAKTYATLRSMHIEEYQRYFNRVKFELDNAGAAAKPTDERLKEYGNGIADPSFATLFYQYGRYLLISSSRYDNPLPSNSQGLWGDGLDMPWKCDYKSNINFQMNYWQAEQANLSEMHQPMLQMIKMLAIPGAKTAKAYYGPKTPGWFYGYTTNGWGWTSPGSNLPWGVFNGGSGWACQHLWEHYAFTRDKKYLQSIYPVLKGAAEFYIATMTKDKQGYLVTSPSTSPENEFITDDKVKSNVTEGATMEKSIVWDLLNNVIQASASLGADEAFRMRAIGVRDSISPLRIGRAGQLMEWNGDWDLNSDEPHHRHVSHLFALHPGHQITVIGTPELAHAAKRTLELRGDYGTGWSIAWKENFWARLRDGDHAHMLLSHQLRYTSETKTIMAEEGGTYGNLFDAHPPFQIDGNFGAVSGMTEMLLQSMETFRNKEGTDSYVIDLLPALPSAWKSGSISGLRARGGFDVNIVWKSNRLSSAVIHSKTGEWVKIRTSNPVSFSGTTVKPIRANGFYNYTLKTKAGVNYQLKSM